MKYINKFKTTEEFNQAIGEGGVLSQLDNYVALTEDNQMVHLKPPFKGLIINTNNTGTTINKWTADSYEKVTLENGENKFTDWNYGFFFDYGMKQEQITSFDFSKYDTSKVTTMSSMFYYCTSLTSLDLSNFDTSKVTDMIGMFYLCTGLTSLDVSSFNTSKVTNMNNMFNTCTKLTSLVLSNFNTSKVSAMSSMFYECSSLTTLDLSSFDTSNVSDMRNMFNTCTKLTSLVLSNFNTSKVTVMSSMFKDCNKLTYIKCKQAFKDWCITNQDTIYLPAAMREGGSGQWDIVK